MKVLLCGDFHLRATPPENRVDDYFQTVCRKLRFVLSLASEEHVRMILQAGDFFDSPSLPYYAFQEFVSLIREYGISIFTVFGQHDLRYRSMQNTPLRALRETGLIDVLHRDLSTHYIKGNVVVYGSSWGEEIRQPSEFDEPAFNILVTHRTVVDRKLWSGQEDFVYAKELLKQHPEYRVILSGDNHKHFVEKEKNRILINPGSLLRSAIDQVDHRPVVYLIDINNTTLTYEPIEVPIEPAEKVFDFTKAYKIKEIDERLLSFVSGLREGRDFGLDFVRNLMHYLSTTGVELSVQRKITELIAEAGGGE